MPGSPEPCHQLVLPLQAVKEEGQDPEEIAVALEATSKKLAKRGVKGTRSRPALLGLSAE